MLRTDGSPGDSNPDRRVKGALRGPCNLPRCKRFGHLGTRPTVLDGPLSRSDPSVKPHPRAQKSVDRPRRRGVTGRRWKWGLRPQRVDVPASVCHRSAEGDAHHGLAAAIDDLEGRLHVLRLGQREEPALADDGRKRVAQRPPRKVRREAGCGRHARDAGHPIRRRPAQAHLSALARDRETRAGS